MERAKTGVEGLDDLIGGGFPRHRTMLISGACGSGKTIFSTQFLCQGVEEGESGVFVTVDERPDLIREDMAVFGWDLKEFEEENKLALLDASAAKIGYPSEEKYSVPQVGLDVDDLILKAMKLVDKVDADRLVLDSIPGLGMQMKNEQEIRNTVLKMNYMFSKEGLTAVMTSEVPEQKFGSGTMRYSKYGVEEYVADGVIMLHYLGVGGESNRSLFIKKMRGTSHTEDVIPMEITDDGVVVKPPEKGYEY